jgi:hypothetical protein
MSLSRASLLPVCVTCALVLGACSRPPARKAKPAEEPALVESKPALSSIEQRAPVVPADLRWVVFGGGSDPLSNQISLAQDLTLASGMFAGRGLVLFASGKQAQVARARASEAEDAGVSRNARRALARLLAPPGSEHVSYEATTLAVDAPATRDHVIATLQAALEREGEPLLVLAASHGEHGATARDNALALWGGWPLTVEDVAELLDHGQRPTRFVVTACYGGGFAELAFVGADANRGARSPEHCGLFAAPWDDESSGCDPDPERVNQESFTIHFLAALRGHDRAGRNKLEEIDIDRDGRVSLLEAHAWGRVHAHSLDVPTTTSERYLREYAPHDDARVSQGQEPEEAVVIKALADELELPNEATARAKLRELERIQADVGALLDEAQQTADDSFYALRIALLERWPLLDHSWDPRADAVLEREGAQILQLLTESELAQGNALASRELEEALAQHDSVRVAKARVQRLVNAFETSRLARALEKRGGAHYEHYAALRKCERFTPEVRRR